MKFVQKELRKKIREGNACYRRKMEDQLQQNNVSSVWKGLKTITGHKGPSSQDEGDQKCVNNLNLFFNRFDQLPTPAPTQSSLLQLPFSASTASCSSSSSVCTALSSQSTHNTANLSPYKSHQTPTPTSTFCHLQKPRFEWSSGRSM